MNVMSLDCEYAQPSGKTIQIGAAAYKARTGELIAEFETYVDPGEPITQYITDLTGITDADVKGAPNILTAYEMLHEFYKKHKCFKNPLVWGAGTRNDSQHIYEEAYPDVAMRLINHNFMGYRVIDVKGIYQSIQIFNNKTVRNGLGPACERMGIGFEGEAHRALTDAKNTFRVWHFLVSKFPGGFK
jgi:inhibitor of KinA sporulation pathway (predicted exonuclease)